MLFQVDQESMWFLLKHSYLPIYDLIKEFGFIILYENEIINYKSDLVETMNNFT